MHWMKVVQATFIIHMARRQTWHFSDARGTSLPALR